LADPNPTPEPFTPVYRIAMAVCYPLVRLWGRLQVEGLEVLPRGGPTLIIANHDSQTDPLAVGVAARKRRQIRALAKTQLWDKPGLGWVLDGMGQIPIERAAGDAQALVNAIDALRGGACIGVFPEGTISVGRKLRARSGIGRLALEVPEARLVCAMVQGCPDIARFPKRPRIRVRFFEPASGQTDPSESPAGLSQRLLDEIRAIAPPVDAGRDPAKTLETYERKLAEREAAAAKRRADAADKERV
jgi:1-acyl-sn-glycerol-3-phosphate acyltransferase